MPVCRCARPWLVLAVTLLVGCEQPLQPRFGDPVDPGVRTAALADGSTPQIAILACQVDWGDPDLAVDCRIDVTGLGAVASWRGQDQPGRGPTWSPDGERIAFSDGDVLVTTIATGAVVNLTNHVSEDRSPAWSPDGQRIVFESDRGGGTELYLMNADGSGVLRLTNGVGVAAGADPDWSPDGTRILFDCMVAPTVRSICGIAPDGSGFSVVLNGGSSAAWSPNGARVLFTAASGEVMQMNPDGSGSVPLPSPVWGATPDWSPDGSRFVVTMSPMGCDSGNICLHYVYVANADGSGGAFLDAYGFSPAWRPAGATSTLPPPPPPPNQAPVARITLSCSDLSCSFDGKHSGDDGTIVSWSWSFGDGGDASGMVIAHDYAVAGTYTALLTVVDDQGATGSTTTSVTVTVPAPPPPPADVIILEVIGSTRGANSHVDLQWRGSTAAEVDIHRNGTRIATTVNDGIHRDILGKRVSGTFTYKVCNAGTSICSPAATVTF